MAKVRYQNWSCKVFPGFYWSLLSSATVLEADNHFSCPKGFWLDVMDEGQYRQEVCREWTEAMEARWDSNPIGMKVGELAGLSSPREYNFTTDKITIEVEMNLSKLKSYCWRERAEEFDRYLRDNWSSRDGFWSFIPSRLASFKDAYRVDAGKRAELVDIMIEWYLLEHVDWEQVSWDVYERLDDIVHSVGVVLVCDDWQQYDAVWDNDTEKYVVGEKIA